MNGSGLPGSGVAGTGRPHAVTNVGGAAYEYDLYGNQNTRAAGGGVGARYLRYSAEQQAVEVGLGSQANPTARSRFWYAGGSRYKREDGIGSGIKRTLYVGNVEIITVAAATSMKRYVAGVAVQDIVGSTVTTRYLFGDHLGSIVRVASASGVLEAGMDFGPFGERRGWSDPRGPISIPTATNRGYTGHEMLDGLDVVHMNGRVFDNRIGRFLQVDPFVQEPGNAQNHNRYTYLWNNPLNATDPSGFIGVKERQWASVVVAVAAFYFCPACSATVYGAAATGAVVGGIATGSWKGALYGAFTATLTFGIGNSSATIYEKALATASVNGVMSSLQGGSFGNAFLAAGAGVLTPGAIQGAVKSSSGQFVASVIVGGSVSALTGGKFANGAVTAALNWAVGRTRNSINLNSDKDAGNPEIAAAIISESNEALRKAGLVGTPMASDELAIRWADVIQPISKKYGGVEVGSLIFKVKGGYSLAGAWSRGARGNVSGLIENGPRILNGTLKSFVHSHPVNIIFSGATWYRSLNYMAPPSDISTAWDKGIDAPD